MFHRVSEIFKENVQTISKSLQKLQREVSKSFRDVSRVPKISLRDFKRVSEKFDKENLETVVESFRECQVPKQFRKFQRAL